MTTRLLLSVFASVLCTASLLFAESGTDRSTDPNEIFNSIMLTMPGAQRDRIDSAATTQRSVHNDGSSTRPSFTSKQMSSIENDAKQAGIDNLPESVREQVRKTMLELENDQIKRVLEFKETRNQRNEK